MNKKGFTLIELMGVIALLALIALIIFPAILNQMKKIDANISEANKKLIYSAIDDYVENDKSAKVCLSNGEKLYVKLSLLKEEGILPNDIDLKGYETVFVNYIDGKYNYEILNTKIDENVVCKGIEVDDLDFSDGSVIYYDVEKDKFCNDYHVDNSITEYNGSNERKTTNNQNSCLKFYSFNYDESSKTVNLLLDHNTTAVIPVDSASCTTYESISKNLYDQLNIDCSNWIKTARIISADEIAKVTKNTKFSAEKSQYHEGFRFFDNSECNGGCSKYTNDTTYGWLHDNTANCNLYGCPAEHNSTYQPDEFDCSQGPMEIRGYYTQDTINNVDSQLISNCRLYLWRVTNYGAVTYHGVSQLSYCQPFGIRPVITFKI